jgi:hypothetical protein
MAADWLTKLLPMITSIRRCARWLLVPQHFLFICLGLIPLAFVVIFIRIHGENIAYFDEFRLMGMVLSIKKGTFDLHRFYQALQVSDHYALFNTLKTVILVVTTDWNLVVGMYVSVALTIFSLVFCVLSLKADRPELALYVLPAFSMLLFSIHQDVNWLLSYSGHFYFGIFFITAALWVLGTGQPGWKRLVAGITLTFMGTFTVGSNVIAWPLLGVALWQFGYRRRAYLVAWVVVAIAALALYWFGVPHHSTGSLLENALHVRRLLGAFGYSFMYLGAFLVSRFTLYSTTQLYWLSALVGILGMLLLVVDVVLLLTVEKDRRAVFRWLVLAGYGWGSGMLIGLSRLAWPEGASYPDVLSNHPFLAWYATLESVFWVALVGLSAIVVWRLAHRARQPIALKLLNLGIIAALMAFFMLFVIQNQRVVATSYANPNVPDQPFTTQPDIKCVRELVFILDDSCLPAWQTYIHQLAAYRLNEYAHLEPVRILPDSYRQGQLVVVEVSRPWYSVEARDWLLAGVDEDDEVFIFPSDPAEESDIPTPVSHAVDARSGSALAALVDRLKSLDSFYYVVQDTDAYQARLAGQLLQGEGFQILSEDRYDPGSLVIFQLRYSR